MTNYNIEERCDIHGSIMYVIMRNGKDYVKTDNKLIASEVIDKLYIAEAVINNS
jgi:hypothetical protein